MTDTEIWKPVTLKGLSHYHVSDQGRVKNIVTGRFLSGTPNSHGYLQLTLRNGAIVKKQFPTIHRLVLEAFVGPRPEGYDGCHINGDRLDNRLVNLRWGTRAQNVEDSRRHGTQTRGTASPHARLTEEQAQMILDDPRPATTLCKILPVSAGMISKIRRGEKWSHLSRSKAS